ncbi:MAG TPA: hypothetical protein VLA21_10410, partial [Candidatus Limnocylindria bacterium]|nr:hypothetical protein [Candidatus Limnocylindria bacterium]
MRRLCLQRRLRGLRGLGIQLRLDGRGGFRLRRRFGGGNRCRGGCGRRWCRLTRFPFGLRCLDGLRRLHGVGGLWLRGRGFRGLDL